MKPFVLIALAAAVALAGCAAQPLPAKTVTATVTATPAPVARSASDPLTELDAWLACYAAVTTAYAEQSDATPAWYPYREGAVSTNADGSFHTAIGFPAGGGSAINTCDASGTVGSPKVVLGGFTDI